MSSIIMYSIAFTIFIQMQFDENKINMQSNAKEKSEIKEIDKITLPFAPLYLRSQPKIAHEKRKITFRPTFLLQITIQKVELHFYNLFNSNWSSKSKQLLIFDFSTSFDTSNWKKFVFNPKKKTGDKSNKSNF